MNQKNLSYYIDVITLKIYALMYRFSALIFYNKKDVYDKKLLLDQFNLKKDPFFYTYTVFDHPDELGNTLLQKNGIYLRHYTDTSNHINPLIPAYYGLVCYNYYLKTNNKNYKNIFLNHAEFCLALTNNDGGLPIQIDYKKFDLKSPWYSGITQGVVASLLLRGFIETKNEMFKVGALNIIDFMVDEKRTNNKLLIRDNGLPWIEEYPGKSPSKVLNGYCFSIISLFEFANIFQDKRIEELAIENFNSLMHTLPHFLYDVGIRHNLKYFQFGNINYQALHIYLFYHLYIITRNEALFSLSKKYYNKTNWKLFYNFYKITRRNKPSFPL